MSEQELHPNVSFAARHSDETMDFLNASIALQRMETLVEDAEAIKEMWTSQSLRSGAGIHSTGLS